MWSFMAKTVSIGAKYFYSIRENDCFYVDKTGFIKDVKEIVKWQIPQSKLKN